MLTGPLLQWKLLSVTLVVEKGVSQWNLLAILAQK
jgi:hypothetical protein